VWAYRGLALERFGPGANHTAKLMKFPFFSIVKHIIRWKIKSRAKAQGIGNHTEQEIIALMKNDIRLVAKVLGSKKFICGDEMCEDDCAIFGFLTQVVWGLPESPYETLANGNDDTLIVGQFYKAIQFNHILMLHFYRLGIEELPNLKKYCIRVKEKLWPDWMEKCAH